MDEQATFETRAVLPPRRSRVGRVALLVPALALVATAWVGLSGAPPAQKAAVAPNGTSPASAASSTESGVLSAQLPEPRYPAEVVGLGVHRLDDVQPAAFRRGDVVALAGWYVATAITDCPPLAAIYRDAALPEIRGDADSWAFCDRSGVLFASQPDLSDLAARRPMSYFEDNRSKNAGLPAVPVSLVIGVVVPPELEIIGERSTPVVVVGRFRETGAGCGAPGACQRELVVDHIAWSPG